MMTLEERIRKAEADLFHAVGAKVDESFLDLANTSLRVRLLAGGSGPPLVLLHGVSLSAAAALKIRAPSRCTGKFIS